MKKITFASYTPFIGNIDDEILKKYFVNAGTNVEIVSWDNEDYNWKDSDLVMIRSTWDFHKTLDKYKEWLNCLETNNIKVLNDISIIKNNIFKEKQINWLKANNIPIMKCEIFSKGNYDLMKKPERTLVETIKKNLLIYVYRYHYFQLLMR